MESGLKHALKREAALRSLKNVILSSLPKNCVSSREHATDARDDS